MERIRSFLKENDAQFYSCILNSQTINLLTYRIGYCGSKMAKCPECGKPLVKRTRKGKYNCENEKCSVIYVRYPNVPALRVVVHESSKKTR